MSGKMKINSTEIEVIRRFLKERLQRDKVTFYGYEKEWTIIYELLKRTSEYGESNSLLLIGPRGSGKTTLISSVLYRLLIEEKYFSKNTIIVYLSGLLHTDDRIALKSITLQMNLENASDGKVFGSFAENLAFLLECLKSGNKEETKSIIFILDEFDLFCSHHNQTLLYNLFDVSQSAQAPICVLGITCRLDVTEMLEKRVKSRFSHRQINILPDSENFAGWLEMIGELLKLPSSSRKNQRNNNIDGNYYQENHETLQNCELMNLKNIFNPLKYSFTRQHIEVWNNHIQFILNDPKTEKYLQKLFYYNTSLAYIKNFLYELVALIDANDHPSIELDDIKMVTSKFNEDKQVEQLLDLSILEMCLVIAIKHHSEIYDYDPFNFEIIYRRFTKFSNTTNVMKNIEKIVILKAFERLKELEIIIPLNNTHSTKMQKEYQMYRLLLTFRQIDSSIRKCTTLPTDVTQWAIQNVI